METSLQKIIAAIVGVLIMFIIPVYIAFEKADDVSYSLALKLTQNFVDNVRNKGYISPEMYSEFVSGLYATNNTYDVNIEHVKKRYDPAIYIYEKTENADGSESKGNLLHVLDYEKYKEQYENGSITIKTGIYNLVNSSIEVSKPSITYNDGTKEGSVITDKEGNELDAKTLYENKIDQYKEQGRIIIDSGEIYADVRKVLGDSFDDDIYIPSTIDDTFKGEIIITKKQGKEASTLPYEAYKNNYFNAVNGVFKGPTYSKASITYVPALMRIKGVNQSAEESEKMYYERINQYRSEEASGDGRLVFSSGEIYADKNKVKEKNGTFDTKLDIEATITTEKGQIIINDDSKIAGYENDLQDYDKYISNYKNGQTMVEEGEIYTDLNSTIEDIRAGIWKKGTTLNLEEAEQLYNSQLSNYENYDRVVVNKGEVYVVNNSATGYDSLTDEIRNITVNGSISVNNSTGWEPNTLDFDKYIEEFRNTGRIEYLAAGEYEATRRVGKLTYELGTDEFEFDFASNEDKMLDSSSQITIEAKYENNDISFGDNKPRVIVKDVNTGTEVSKEITSISEIKEIVNSNSVVINGITYNGTVNVATQTYNFAGDSDYIIEIETPEFLALDNKLPSSIYVMTSTSEMNAYLLEYIENSNITISKTYDKDRLTFQRETLELKKDGETVIELYHDQDKTKYEEYLSNATLDIAGSVSKVTVDAIILTEDKLNVEYLEMQIDGRPTITISQDNMSYIDDFYNNGRIVIVEPEVWEKADINISYPKLTIYEKNTNNVIYEFSGKKDIKHEKYDEYVNEYRTTGKVTIIPTREYTADDVTVIPSKITIKVQNEKENKTIVIDDNDSNYENYLNQFETTGKIKMSEPEVYNINTDIEVQDPHIQIRQNGNLIIDIYEKDNKELYDNYKEQYLSNGQITLEYNKEDIICNRAKIVINELESKESNIVKNTKTIYDSDENYLTYLHEYENTNKITFAGSLQYTADELIVTEPSITIKDPDTGSVIVKYEGDYSKLDLENRYGIIYDRFEEYEENNQLINKEVTYVNGENCYFEKAHVVNEEVITDKQIVSKLFKDTGVTKLEFLRQCMLGNGDMYNSLVYMNENSYVMHEGDQINVTVKNKNQTVASVFYSLLTANVGNEEIAKIYVDYGGTIKNNGETILTEETGMVSSSTGRLFKYKGQPEEVILEAGTYDIECWGAAGGYSEETDVTKVGKGAYTKARFTFSETTTVYVYVGGQGSKYSETNESNGGYNGGGNSYNGYGGGGSTDVRLLKGNATDSDSLLTRIIVAAGGGGNSKTTTGYGGSGGNQSGGINGKPNVEYKGLGAISSTMIYGYNSFVDRTRTPNVEKSVPDSEKGNFGTGGSVDFDGAGAGGAGYFGGSASHNENAGGGGGMSYIYDNQSSYKSGTAYPLVSEVLTNYDAKILENIKPYISAGKWKNITNEGNSFKEYLTGDENMTNPLTFTGIKDMKGNKGNGYAIIKKVD